jgi:hypothetical protein
MSKKRKCRMRWLAGIQVFILFSPVCNAAVIEGLSFPQPKEAVIYPDPPITLLPECEIVLEDNAGEPELYAAQRLQHLIQRSFSVSLSIRRQSDKGIGKQKIVLCKRGDVAAIDDRLGVKEGLDDCFAIKTDAQEILVWGINGRAVIYGCHFLFDLLKKEDNKILAPSLFVRDWADIRWRGRPTEYLRLHDCESLDVCAWARINFIDVRDTSQGDRKATYGFIPGEPIDQPSVQRVIREAHRRGIFTYATVSCGVNEDEFDAVLAAFEELLRLGADGIWLSFDDPGPGGDATALIRRVVELGKKYDVTGQAIAITPPTGSYQQVDTYWNRTVASVDGAEAFCWYFTITPEAKAVEQARQIGLQTLPAWWHNWPRPAGGLLHEMASGRSLYSSPWAYYELMPLSAGWNSPKQEQLKDAVDYTDAVMLWQTCPAEYVAPVLGFWAWDTRRYDWPTNQRQVYSFIFGENQADQVRQFDALLAGLKKLYYVPRYKDTSPKVWPARLIDPKQKQNALALIDQMERLYSGISQHAPADSKLSLPRLYEHFLKPMGDVVAYGRKITQLEFPEHVYPNFIEKTLAIYEKDGEGKLFHYLQSVRPEVMQLSDKVADELADLKYIENYRQYWQKLLSGADFWKQISDEKNNEKVRLAELRRNALAEFEKTISRFDGFAGEPAEMKFRGRVAAVIDAEYLYGGKIGCVGRWGGGLYEKEGAKYLVLCGSKDRSYGRKDTIEFSASVAVPPFRNKLMLYVEIRQPPMESPHLYQNYRFTLLRIDRKTVWNQDAAETLGGWMAIDVTDMATAGGQMNIGFILRNTIESGGFDNFAAIGRIVFVDEE